MGIPSDFKAHMSQLLASCHWPKDGDRLPETSSQQPFDTSTPI